MLTTDDGFRYEGGWKGGEIDGEGVASYRNGDVYTGSFVAGKRQGKGVMRYASGQIAAGEWEDNRLARPVPGGEIVNPDGSIGEENATPDLPDDAGAAPAPDADSPGTDGPGTDGQDAAAPAN